MNGSEKLVQVVSGGLFSPNLTDQSPCRILTTHSMHSTAKFLPILHGYW